MRAVWMVGLVLALAACSTSQGGAVDSDAGVHAGADGGVMPGAALFLAPEPWTKDVSALAPAARSQDIIQTLQDSGGWGNGDKLQIDFSIPLFFADAQSPRMTVTGAPGFYGEDSDPVPLQMPVPAGSNFEGSSDLSCNTDESDCHLLVAAEDERKLYELYNGTQAGDGLQALGVFVWDLTEAYPDSERGDQCTSADAAGLPMAALLPTADEVASGAVHHALRFILPNAQMKRGVYVHPASHAGDPQSDDANAPPYGVRLRLKQSFDESGYDPGEKVILEALKTYGMILSDGGNIALTFADDRTSAAKWADLGITAQSFQAIPVSQFDVVDLGDEIPITDDCVRNP